MAKILLFNDTSRYQHYGCDLVMFSIVANLEHRGHAPVSVHRVGTSVNKRFDEIMRRHPDAAAIVVNGEGVIHHDRKHALQLAGIARKAARFGIPCYLINAALFDNSASTYEQIAEYKAVYVRDGESCAAARAHGIDATLVADLSFDGIALLGGRERVRRGAVITDSVHDDVTAQLQSLARRTGSRWQSMRRPVALPFAWMRLIGARRFVSRVRSAEVVFTGRFHTVTACIATRTPFFALPSNTRKTEALLKDVFGDALRMLPEAPSALIASESPIGRIAFDEAESVAIRAYLERAKAATSAMFDRLVKFPA